MPKTKKQKAKQPEPHRRLCLDRMCKWPDGGECEAEAMNSHAFDAEDFVCIRQWDSCPRMALEEERRLEEEQQNPPTDDLPVPVLDGDGLDAAVAVLQEWALANDPTIEDLLDSTDWEGIVRASVSAYLRAVEFGA